MSFRISSNYELNYISQTQIPQYRDLVEVVFADARRSSIDSAPPLIEAHACIIDTHARQLFQAQPNFAFLSFLPSRY